MIRRLATFSLGKCAVALAVVLALIPGLARAQESLSTEWRTYLGFGTFGQQTSLFVLPENAPTLSFTLNFHSQVDVEENGTNVHNISTRHNDLAFDLILALTLSEAVGVATRALSADHSSVSVTNFGTFSDGRARAYGDRANLGAVFFDVESADSTDTNQSLSQTYAFLAGVPVTLTVPKIGVYTYSVTGHAYVGGGQSISVGHIVGTVSGGTTTTITHTSDLGDLISSGSIGEATLTIAPTGISFQPSPLAISGGRNRFFADQTLSVSWGLLSAQYEELGPAHKADSLSLALENTSVTVSGAGGSWMGPIDVSRVCDATDQLQDGDTDIEDIGSCISEFTLDIPADVSVGAHTLSIPASPVDREDGSSRIGIVINGVPHQGTGDMPYSPVAAESVVFTVEHDTEPVFAESEPLVLTVGEAADWTPPAVSGGNGSVTVDRTDPGIPGMTFSEADGRISGTPTRVGAFTYRAVATDSDSQIDSTRSNDVATSETGIRVVLDDTVPEFDESGTHVFVVGRPVAWSPPQATGGNGQVSHRYFDPRIPGLAIDGAGRLTGTPTRAGRHTYRVVATDSDSDFDPDRSDDVTVAEFDIRVVEAADSTVALAATSLAGFEGTTLDVVVEVTPVSADQVTVPYSLGNDTDSATDDALGADYADPGGETLTIAAGNTRGTIGIGLETDSVTDGGEVFTLALGTPTSAESGMVTAGTPTVATLTILEPLELSGDAQLDEGADAGPNRLTVRATLGANASSDLSVTLTVAPGSTARPAEDYLIGLPVLTVPSGMSVGSAVVSFRVLDDDVNEQEEQVVLVAESAEYGGRGEVTVRITDDDAGLGNMRLAYAGPGSKVREGESARFDVVTAGRMGTDLTVSWAVSRRGEAAAADVSRTSGRVVFGSDLISTTGEDDIRVRSFEVPILDDDVAEFDEELVVEITGLSVPGSSLTDPGRAIEVVQREASVAIAENDEVTLSLSGAPVLTESEATTHTVHIGGGVPPAALTLDVAVTPAGAAADPGDVTVNPGDREVGFEVTPADDADSADGGLTVAVAPVWPAAGPSFPLAVAGELASSVRDDDVTVSVSFDAGAYSIAEGGPSVAVTISMDRLPVRPVRIPVTLADPDGFTTTLQVFHGYDEQTVELMLAAPAGSVPPSNTTLQMGFGTLPANVATASANSSAQVTLLDSMVSLSASPATLEEGDGQTVTVTAALTGAERAGDLVVTLDVGAEGGTAGPADLSVAANLAVTIPAGDLSATATFEIVDDTVVEPEELVVVAGTTDAASDAVSNVTVTVRDDAGDMATLGIAESSGSPAVWAEGATVSLDVSLGALEADVLVPWGFVPLNPGAGAADVVAPSSGTLTFAAGSPAQTVFVTIREDGISEDAENALVRLGTPSVPGNPSLADRITVSADRVTDSIPANGELTVSLAGPATAREGLNIKYEVRVAGGVSTEDVIVTVTVTSATADALLDYTSPTSPVTVPAGASTATFDVLNSEDVEVESTETLTVDITGVQGGGGGAVTASGATRVETGILDDDFPVAFALANYSVTEGGNAALVTVSLSEALDREVTIPLTVTPHGGASAADLAVAPPASVVIAAGVQSATFPVQAFDDRFDDDGESFQVTLGVDSVTPGAITVATVSVTDNDTGVTNTDPTLDDAAARSFTVGEDAVPGDPVGAPIAATDTDGDALAYSVSGTDASAFGVTGAGQLTVARGMTLDFETDPMLEVVVEVRDGLDAMGVPDSVVDASVSVTVMVTDADEPPSAQPAPRLLVGFGTAGAALSVSWSQPDNPGEAVTMYETRYREEGSAGAWTAGPGTSALADTAATITGLVVGRRYEVQVRSSSPEGTSPWSPSAVAGLGANALRLEMSLGPADVASLAEDSLPDVKRFDVTLGGVDFLVDPLPVSLGAVDGTAEAGTDFGVEAVYVNPPHEQRFSGTTLSTQVNAEFLVPDDDTVENDKGFAMRASAGGVFSNRLEITITDTDTATLSMGGPSVPVAEGSSAVFTVTLSAPVDGPVRAELSVAAAATLAGDLAVTDDGADFRANSAANARSFFVVPVSNDMLAEGDEPFTVSLTGVSSDFGNRISIASASASASATIAASDPITLSLVTGLLEVDEGANVEVGVSLSGGVGTEDVLVDYTVAGLVGDSDLVQAVPGDFTADPSPLTVAAGSTRAVFTISIAQDEVAEPDKGITVSLSNARGGGTHPDAPELGAADSSVTVTISGDLEQLILSASRATFPEDGSLASVTITAATESGNAVASEALLTLTVARRSEADFGDDDYSLREAGSFDEIDPPTLATLTVASGASSGRVSFVLVATDDDIVEADETFVVDARRVSGFVVSAVTLTIDDTDRATLSLVAPDEAVDESAGVAQVDVALEGEVDAEITLGVAVVGGAGAGSATGGGVDHGDVTYSATIAEGGSPSGGPALVIVDDSLSEPAETVLLEFVNMTSALLASIDLVTGTVTIAASDPLTLGLEGPRRVGEEAGTVPYTVSVTGGESTDTVTVNLGTDTDAGTATRNFDYTDPPTPLLIDPGEVTGTFDMLITDDPDAEDDETVVVQLLNPTGGGGGPGGVGLGAVPSVTTTIVDNDHPEVSVAFVPAGIVSAREGLATRVTLTLDLQPGREVRVPVTAEFLRGAGTGDVRGVPATVTFGAENTLQVLEFTPIQDGADDDGEGLFLRIGDIEQGRVFTSSPASIEVDIVDVDGRGPFVLLTTDVASLAESAAATPVMLTAEAMKVGVLREAVTVTVSLGTGAGRAGAADHDTSVTLPTLTLSPGTLTASAALTLDPSEDEVVEADEPIVLTAAVGGYGVDAASVLIEDNDDARLSVSGPGALVGEGDGFAMLSVGLSRAVDAPVTVTVETVDGAALAGEDYTALTLTHTFAANTPADSTRLVQVPIINDEAVEGQEVFSVTISAFESALSDRIDATGSDSAAVTINASDQLQVALVAPGSVGEEDGSISVTVEVREGTSSAPIEVSVRVLPDSTAVEGEDYTGPIASPVSLDTGEVSVVFEVPLIDDAENDDGEFLVLEIFEPSGGGGGAAGIMLDASASTVTVTIVDNDDVVLVGLGSATVSVSEGDTASVALELSEMPDQEMTVEYAVTGADPGDWEDPGGGTLTVAAGAATAAIELPVTDDEDPELAETVTVSLSGVGFVSATDDMVRLDGPTVATVRIASSDAIVLSLGGIVGASVAEGAVQSYRVVALGLPVEEDVTVDVEISGEVGPADYDQPGPVFVRPRTFSTRFFVGTRVDSVSDPNEEMVVALANARGGAIPVLIEPSSLTATVTETNTPPSFAPGTQSRSVEENSAAGTAVGDPVAATDRDPPDTLSYTLEDAPSPAPPAASLFGIDPASGQITVAAPGTPDHEASATLTVVVAVSDGKDDMGVADTAVDARTTVEITVTDALEPPAAPAGLAVMPADAQGHRNLSVSWTPPPSAGIPPVTGYDVEHKRSDEGDEAYTDRNVTISGATASVPGLDPGTRYDVRVRASNDEGVGDWSAASGSTDAGHGVSFAVRDVTVIEGQRALLAVRVSPVSSADLSVTYLVRNESASDDDHTPAAGTGTVTVPANEDSAMVTISVTNDTDPESAEVFALSIQEAAQVGIADNRAFISSPSEVSVTIAANDAVVVSLGPAALDVDEGGTAEFTVFLKGDNSTAAVTAGVTVGGSAAAGTDYSAVPASVVIPVGASSARLRVTTLADSETDPGDTIVVGLDPTSLTGPNITGDAGSVTATIVERSAAPVFAADPAVVHSREVAENSPPGTAVGAAFPALDRDGDALAYRLEAPGAPGAPLAGGLFEIDGDGQIAVAAGAALDHESAAAHTVVVAVRDGLDARGFEDLSFDARLTALVSVTDVDEVPPAPVGVAVAPALVGGHVTLSVVWTAPEAPGTPAVTGHLIEYRVRGGAAESARTLSAGADPGAVVAPLETETAYDVRVRAVNDEGQGAWSAPAAGRTEAGIVLEMGDASVLVPEGEDAVLTVEVTPAPAAELSGAYTVRAGSAQSGLDYSDPGSGAFTVGAGSSTALITMEIRTDTATELNEDFSVSLVSATDGSADSRAVIGPAAETAVTIEANDTTELSLSARETHAMPGGTFTLTVSVSGDAVAGEVAVSVPVGGDAVAGSDYTAPAPSVTIATSATSQTFEISLSAAAVTGRTLEVGLGAVSGGGPGPSFQTDPGSVTLTVVGSNAPPAFGLPRVSLSVAENSAAATRVDSAVTATDPDGDTLTYSLTGADASLFGIAGDTGQVTVAPGAVLDHEASGSHTVTVWARDGKDHLGLPDTSVDASVTVVVVVLDVAETPPVVTSLSVSPAGDGGHSRLAASWAPPAEAGHPPVTGYVVEIRKAGEGDESYVRVPHGGTGTTVEIGGLLPSTSYRVRVTPGNRDGLGQPLSADGATGSGTAVTMAAAGVSVGEGSGTAQVEVGLSRAAPTGGVAVTYSVRDVEALEGVDYSVASERTVTVAQGATSARIAVTIDDDDAPEQAESLVVALAGASEAGDTAVLGERTETTVTIGASDSLALDLSAPGTVTVGGAVDATVSLSGDGSYTEVAMGVSSGGSAQSGTDYAALAESLTISAPATSGTVAVSALPGASPGAEIEIAVSVTDPMVVVGVSTVTVTITDPNSPPTFDPVDSPGPYLISENADRSATDEIGDPIGIGDNDAGDTLVFSVEDPDGLFKVTEVGTNYFQIVFDPDAGSALDYETARHHTVTAAISDGKNAIGVSDPSVDTSMVVTITVLDVAEPPAAPTLLSASAAPGDPDGAITLGWVAVDTEGAPPVSGYDIQHKGDGRPDSEYTTDHVSHAGPQTQATVSGLDAGSSVTVRVRSVNAEGASDWVEATGSTDPLANEAPAFLPDSTPRPREVGELAAEGTEVGAPLVASDNDLDPLTFSLAGGAGAFTVRQDGAGVAQVVVAAAGILDHESEPTVTVTVGVSDGRDAAGNADPSADASVVLSVTVLDESEPPPEPTGLSVRSAVDESGAALTVNWVAPDTTGVPPVTGYDVQHKRADNPDDSAFASTGVTHSGVEIEAGIAGLALDVAYDIRVRASNDEGDGEWAYVRGTTSGTDLDVDESGEINHHDALLIFYSWRFGEFLRANQRLLDLVYGRIQQQSDSTIEPIEVLENAEAAQESAGISVLDVDENGETNHHDALLTFYSWRFGEFLRANQRLLDLVYGRIQQQSGSTIQPIEVLENAENLPR